MVLYPSAACLGPVVSIECTLDMKEGYAQFTGIPRREKDQADMLTLRNSMGTVRGSRRTSLRQP